MDPTATYYIEAFARGVAPFVVCFHCAASGEAIADGARKGYQYLKCRLCRKSCPAHAHNYAYIQAHALNPTVPPFANFRPPEPMERPKPCHKPPSRTMGRTRLGHGASGPIFQLIGQFQQRLRQLRATPDLGSVMAAIDDMISSLHDMAVDGVGPVGPVDGVGPVGPVVDHGRATGTPPRTIHTRVLIRGLTAANPLIHHGIIAACGIPRGTLTNMTWMPDGVLAATVPLDLIPNTTRCLNTNGYTLHCTEPAPLTLVQPPTIISPLPGRVIFAAWNAGSLKKRMPAVKAAMALHNVDVLFVCETLIPPEDPDIAYYSPYMGEKTIYGVALILGKGRSRNDLNVITAIPGLAIWFTYSGITVGGVYLPPSCYSHAQILAPPRCLKGQYLLIGDFNAHLGAITGGPKNRPGNLLAAYMDRNQLSLVPSATGGHTFASGWQRSVIDHVLTSGNPAGLVSHVMPAGIAKSCHRMIFVQVPARVTPHVPRAISAKAACIWRRQKRLLRKLLALGRLTVTGYCSMRTRSLIAQSLDSIELSLEPWELEMLRCRQSTFLGLLH